MRKSYSMLFRVADRGDMQKLSMLCEMLRDKGACYSITDITIRDKPGYEVFWYINPEKQALTRFGKRDRRFR